MQNIEQRCWMYLVMRKTKIIFSYVNGIPDAIMCPLESPRFFEKSLRKMKQKMLSLESLIFMCTDWCRVWEGVNEFRRLRYRHVLRGIHRGFYLYGRISCHLQYTLHVEYSPCPPPSLYHFLSWESRTLGECTCNVIESCYETTILTFVLLFSSFESVQLEEPFNILPLRQYSDNVNDSVDFVVSAYSIDKNVVVI